MHSPLGWRKQPPLIGVPSDSKCWCARESAYQIKSRDQGRTKIGVRTAKNRCMMGMKPRADRTVRTISLRLGKRPRAKAMLQRYRCGGLVEKCENKMKKTPTRHLLGIGPLPPPVPPPGRPRPPPPPPPPPPPAKYFGMCSNSSRLWYERALAHLGPG